MDIVITTIFPPTAGTRLIAEGLIESGGKLWVIGDAPGPERYDLPQTRFLPLQAQLELPFQLARKLPQRHYARKNLGYLQAIQDGCNVLVETDDDNLPLDGFWTPRASLLEGTRLKTKGWINTYRHFTDQHVWPRGLPLESVNTPVPARNAETSACECLIQQGLANRNPDVDAVYRMTSRLPLDFEERPPVLLDRGCWCPFNSQNTTHFPSAFPLLYLPSHCSFRMTDIWRSFIAQRCLWEMDSCIGFTAPTMYQERNEHDLLRDFEQEIPGYLLNERIRNILETLELQPGREPRTVCDNLLECYESLVRNEILPPEELSLATLWTEDLISILP